MLRALIIVSILLWGWLALELISTGASHLGMSSLAALVAYCRWCAMPLLRAKQSREMG
jgi:hypothetical protein